MLVFEHQHATRKQWSAIGSIAEKSGISAETSQRIRQAIWTLQGDGLDELVRHSDRGV